MLPEVSLKQQNFTTKMNNDWDITSPQYITYSTIIIVTASSPANSDDSSTSNRITSSTPRITQGVYNIVNAL